MAKTDLQKLTERLEEIEKLQEDKARINERLMFLTAVKQEKKNETPKPDGFSLMDEIEDAIRDAGKSMSVKAIASAISLKTGYEPPVTSVRSTAKYMVTKKGRLKMDETTKEFGIVLQNNEVIGDSETETPL